METKISKIQFRQDTQANWENINPILGKGEPGYVISGEGAGLFKIGDGVKNWNSLEYQTNGNISITECPNDNKLYGRKKDGSNVGTWQEITHTLLDPRKSLNDIYSAPYNTEINLNTVYKLSDGTNKNLYAFKFNQGNLSGSQLISLPNTCLPTRIIEASAKIIVGTRQYVLPVENSHLEAELVLEERTPIIIIKALETITNAQIDLYIIYTKD